MFIIDDRDIFPRDNRLNNKRLASLKQPNNFSQKISSKQIPIIFANGIIKINNTNVYQRNILLDLS